MTCSHPNHGSADHNCAPFPPADLDVLRYAAEYGQASEDEAPVFLAAADEIERLRAQLDMANEQIRQLCAESDAQVVEIRANEAELLKRGVVIENLWARLDEFVAERNAMADHVNQLAAAVKAWLRR